MFPTFGRVSGRRGALALPAAITLRRAAMVRPHFPDMAFETLCLFILPFPSKLLDTMFHAIRHRAPGQRFATRRLAGVLRSGRAGKNQDGEQGNEEECFHGLIQPRVRAKVAV
jgi:hypothetical protein